MKGSARGSDPRSLGAMLDRVPSQELRVGKTHRLERGRDDYVAPATQQADQAVPDGHTSAWRHQFLSDRASSQPKIVAGLH